MKLTRVLSIIAVLLVVYIAGCKKDEDPGIRPKVSSTNPISNAVNVGVSSKILASFSTVMDASSITSSTFTLQQGTTSVAGAAEYKSGTASFTPTVALMANTPYTATITTGVKDKAGKTLAKNYVWGFTTSAKSDLILPTVVSIDPANSATGVALNKLVVATFSEPMDPATITSFTFALRQGTASVTGTVAYTGSTATFTPSSNLTINKLYTGTITTGAKDIAGNALASDYAFSFTTSNSPDVTSPTVTVTDPLDNATAVTRNKVVSITFNEAIDPLTISASTFSLKQGTTAVAGTVAYAGTTATFTPTTVLTANSLYTATITTGVKDVAGNALAANTVWSFTTGSTSDIILPTISVRDPLDNATAVILNKVVSITFSEAMDPLTINANTFSLKQGTTAVAGTVAYAGTTATFTPTAALTANSPYTATITTGVKDLAGNALAANTVWSFTTGSTSDVTLPTVSVTDPLNNATAVILNKVVSLTFSEAMDPLTISANTFSLKQGTTAVAGAVAYSGTTATFTPTNILSAGSLYTATITTGAKDVAGNALAANTVWSFTTAGTLDTTLPTVTVTDPLDNATAVAQNKVVGVTFSEAMDPLTISANTFSLKQGTTAVAGAVAYSGTTATFTPTNILTAGSVYTATLTTGAKDVAGNALASNSVWSFTTASTVPNLAAVNLGSSINYVILAKTAISNISISAVTGDLGLSPAATSFVTGFALTNATGFATASQVTGKIFAADMAPPTPINLTTAVNDMITAYNDAAGRPTPDFSELATGNIGGRILTPGLYKWTNTVTLPADVTISGGANDVFIFQIAGNLIQSNGVNITLTGGAQAKNIFWQVAGQVTLGTTSHFEGIILCMTGINFQTGASMNGRALAQTAVTLDGNAITKPN